MCNDLVAELTVSVGEVKMIRGQGMPSFRHHDLGNLYIQFDVKFPDKLEPLPAGERDLLEKILGSQKQPDPKLDSMTEDFELENVDAGNQRRAHGATSMDEDEEDGVPAGAERMQCASQ